jgi:hypothetical protein
MGCGGWKGDSWSNPDPEPGAFDDVIDRLGADQIELHAGNPNACLLNLAPRVDQKPSDALKNQD